MLGAARSRRAKWELSKLFANDGDIEGLRVRARSGDPAATKYLVAVLISCCDLPTLEEWALSGEIDAVHGLADLYVESGQHQDAVRVLTSALSAEARQGAPSLDKLVRRETSSSAGRSGLSRQDQILLKRCVLFSR